MALGIVVLVVSNGRLTSVVDNFATVDTVDDGVDMWIVVFNNLEVFGAVVADDCGFLAFGIVVFVVSN